MAHGQREAPQRGARLAHEHHRGLFFAARTRSAAHDRDSFFSQASVLYEAMMPEPRGIVFDLDGTLIDSAGDIAAAVNHALLANGRKELPMATIRRFVGDGARMLCSRAVGLPEKHPDVDRVLESYLAFYLSHPADHTLWMPYARAVLEDVRRFRLAIATNKPRDTTEIVLARLGVRSLFSALCAAGDVALIKPAPDPIYAIARQLALTPDQMVMIGDGPQDIEAGRRAGCRTIGVQGGFAAAERLLAAQPDVIIGSLAELPAILDRWEDATMRAR
jgi:phosphoglycolate phosphatase